MLPKFLKKALEIGPIETHSQVPTFGYLIKPFYYERERLIV